MLNPEKFQKAVDYCIVAHDQYAKNLKNKVRFWDQKTLYSIHPIWCATTLLTETLLPEDIRKNGAQALLFHDILEDTNADLPKDVSKKVRSLVQELTFQSSDEATEKIWERSDEAKLLKLYDKVSNLLDGSWMTQKKIRAATAHIEKLADVVKKRFGMLNIITIAEAVCKK